MAVIKVTSAHTAIGRVCKYVLQEQKIPSGLYCGYNLADPNNAGEEMEFTKRVFRKTGGRTYKHYIQSFHRDEKVNAQEVYQIARETVEKCHLFDDFEVLVATHEDRDHLHTHIVVNSVSYVDGHKFNQSPTDLRDLKEVSDQICREHGLTIAEKGKTFEHLEREETSADNNSTYRLLQKAEIGKADSYVQRIALAVLDAQEIAGSREEFTAYLADNRIDTIWRDNRKYITFIDLERQQAGEAKCKIRNKRLMQYYNIDLTKERLEHEFEKNARERAESEEITRTAGELAATAEAELAYRAAQEQESGTERADRAVELRESSAKRGNRDAELRESDARTAVTAGERRTAEAERANRDAERQRQDAARCAEAEERKRELERAAEEERSRLKWQRRFNEMERESLGSVRSRDRDDEIEI